MNDDNRCGMEEFTASRFAAEDAARSAWLKDRIQAEAVDEVKLPGLCKRGHDDWWTNSKGVKRCRTCHRDRMAESRARRGA